MFQVLIAREASWQGTLPAGCRLAASGFLQFFIKWLFLRRLNR
jgi:hypothetical protein